MDGSTEVYSDVLRSTIAAGSPAAMVPLSPRSRVGIGTLATSLGVPAACLLGMLLVPASHARVYAHLDAQGRLQVSESAAPGAMAFDPQRPWKPPSVRRRTATPTPGPLQPPVRWQPLLQQVAHEHGLELPLLHAVVQVESGYNPQARSRAGAQGLMQVIPSTGKRFGATDLYDPLQNLRAGARYLAWLQQRFNGDLALVLAGYNAGEGAVHKHGQRVPPYAETRAYVQRVSALYHASRAVAR